jgi:short-subunit dehydrogenase
MSEATLDPKRAKERYGPWAVIAGGSDGTGEAYARQLAEVGINVMLVARRAEVLDALAKDIREKHGVETRVLVQDLMDPAAAKNMLDASADLDVGMYVSNAGIDGTGAMFFDQPIDRWLRMISMNVDTVTAATHGFGNRLIKRGRGGIVIMSSSSGLGGTPFLGMYSATKAYEMVLVEALWGELSLTDVDIIGVVAPAMDTPFFRRSIAGQDFKLGAFIFAPEVVAQEALAQLGHKPLIMFPSSRRPDPEVWIKARYDELLQSLDVGKSYFPKGEKVEG